MEMSLLKNIFESVLNEIGADDAYNRFYSQIPREDYDAILDGETNPDKFIQFILNCVRDEKSTVQEAVDAVKKYHASDPMVRQNVLNKFRAGDYKEALDVSFSIDYLQSGGVISKNKFAKEGYIKIAENEDWLVTCTTNYLANSHYFGQTKWCTASDRMGRWDGYNMFTGYTGNGDYDEILIQFTCKNEEKLSEIGLQYKYIQVQIEKYVPWSYDSDEEEDYRLTPAQICDATDTTMYSDMVNQLTGGLLKQILENHTLYEQLVEIQKKQGAKEEVYQEYETKRIEAKRKRDEEKKEAKRRELNAQADQLNREERERINKMALEGYGYGIFDDQHFLDILFERDVFATDIPETDEELNMTYGFVISDINCLKGNLRALVAATPMGVEYYVDYGDNGDEFELKSEWDGASDNRSYYVFMLAKESGDGDYKLMWHSELLGNQDTLPWLGVPDIDDKGSGRFVVMKMGKDDKAILYDAELNKFIEFHDSEYNTTINYTYKMGNGIFVFTHFDGDEPYVYFDKNQSVKELYNYKFKGDEGFGAFVNSKSSENDILTISEKGFGRIEPMEGLNLANIRKLAVFNYGGPFFEVKFRGPGGFGDTARNIYDVGNDEYVFGVFGSDVDWEVNSQKDGSTGINLYMKYPKVNNRLIANDDNPVRYLTKDLDTGEYYLTMWDRTQYPCDKYGKTQKQIIGDKNFEDWKKKGGYSPEVQAQMDKMWAEKGENDFSSPDGSQKALAAWNDDDRGLDKAYGGALYGEPFDLSDPETKQTVRRIQKLDDDPRWRGYAGLTDPTANSSVKDRENPRPFFRIGKDGKPLDQPWYDEDEVPAKLSDRVVRENKIRKEYNNLISLMGRMGLIED